LINRERWSGKIRLVGYVDVFFLICYANNARFEHGIIIYKDEKGIVDTLKRAKKEARELDLVPVGEKEKEHGSDDEDEVLEKTGPKVAKATLAHADDKLAQASNENEDPPKYFRFKQQILDYMVTSVGHDIGLKTKYPVSSVKKYEIKIRKHSDILLRKRIRRAIKQHDTLDLIADAVNSQIISINELAGHVIGHAVMGGVAEDARKKFMAGMTASQRSGTVGLSGDSVM